MKHSDDIELFLPLPHRHPDMPGMRYDGSRWVDEEKEDRPFVPIIRQEQPGLDMFGGTGERKPPRLKSRKPKTRRRGGF